MSEPKWTPGRWQVRDDGLGFTVTGDSLPTLERSNGGKMINYELAKKEAPALKARLTRAKKQGYKAVLAACYTAVAHWHSWGAFPDNWHIWQVALVDAANEHTRKTGEYVNAPRLDTL